MTAYFRDARLKIDWAEKHFGNLQIAVRALEESSIATVQRNPNTAVQELIHTLPNAENVLLEMSLIVGDFIHNLHSALDFAWVSLINECGLPITRRTKFPVFDNRPSLEGVLKGVKIDTLFPNVFRFIVSDVQSYEGRNELICALHNLDISDKHLLLLGLLPMAGIKKIAIREKSSGQLYQGSGMPVWNLGPYVIPFADEVDIEDKGQLFFKVTIKEAGILNNMELMRLLSLFSESVRQIVEEMEKLCP